MQFKLSMGVLPHQTPAAFDCASGNKHSKNALIKVRTLGCLQVKHNTINSLIFTDAGLWGILHAQHCQYTAQQRANIYWFGSQNCPHQSENAWMFAGGSLGQTLCLQLQC